VPGTNHGGQREHRYDRLVSVMEERGIPREPFEGYLDAFRFGMPPEGGFAVGLERFVAHCSDWATCAK